MSRIDPRVGRWLLWLAPFAVLALAIGWQVDWGREWRRVPPPEAPVVPAPVGTTVLPEYRIEGGLASMAATVERPLFNATRRPAPVPVAEGPKPTIQRGQFTLTGTLITDQAAIAFLKETGEAGKARSVRKGESINGMTVAEIAPDRVRFTMGDDAEDLELKVAKGPKTTTQPAGDASQAQQPVVGQAGPAAQPEPGSATRARPGARAQGGLAGPGAATDNVRANRRAARAADAQGGAAAGATQDANPQGRVPGQRRQR